VTITDSKEDYLAKNPIFAEIPREKISKIARDAQYKVVPPHTIISREGDPGNNFYVINSGNVRIFKRGVGGVEIDLAQLGPGDFFGQLAILAGGLNQVTVEALEETYLTILSRDQFDGILKGYPNASFAFAKQMSNYLATNIQVVKNKTEHRFTVSRSSWFDFLLIFALSLLCGLIYNHVNPNGIPLIPKVSGTDVVRRIGSSLALSKHSEGISLFVDARPNNLFKHMHIKGAVNIPSALFDIIYMMEFSNIEKEKEIIVYGRTFSKHYDEEVARKFLLRGHKNIVILGDNLSKCKQRGLPVSS
jgi:CRP-like cAMP-binding protein